MEVNYYNTDFSDSSKRKCSHWKGDGVLLMFLSVSLVLALGSLCVLAIMYAGKSTMCDALTDQKHKDSKLQSDPENSRSVSDGDDVLLHQICLSSCSEFSSVCKPCDLGWTVYREKCYFFSSEEQTWFESRDSCEASGAHLVVINSEEIQDFLVSKIKETRWIGLNDLETEGRWVWVNNQTLNETGVQFWLTRTNGPDEPNDWTMEDLSGEDCACLGNFEGYLNVWFDNSCKYQKKFICQKEYQFPDIGNN